MRTKKQKYPTKATTYNIPVTTYLFPAQATALDKLVKDTGTRKVDLLREAVNDLLKKYKVKGGTK